jgi:hypothetical protein
MVFLDAPVRRRRGGLRRIFGDRHSLPPPRRHLRHLSRRGTMRAARTASAIVRNGACRTPCPADPPRPSRRFSSDPHVAKTHRGRLPPPCAAAPGRRWRTTSAVPITVAYGDGIGPEIMTSTMKILEAAGAHLKPEVRGEVAALSTPRQPQGPRPPGRTGGRRGPCGAAQRRARGTIHACCETTRADRRGGGPPVAPASCAGPPAALRTPLGSGNRPPFDAPTPRRRRISGRRPAAHRRLSSSSPALPHPRLYTRRPADHRRRREGVPVRPVQRHRRGELG